VVIIDFYSCSKLKELLLVKGGKPNGQHWRLAWK